VHVEGEQMREGERKEKSTCDVRLQQQMGIKKTKRGVTGNSRLVSISQEPEWEGMSKWMRGGRSSVSRTKGIGKVYVRKYHNKKG